MAGERSDNGELFVSFCALNNLAVVSTMFPLKEIHRYTWTLPNGQHHNQIDHHNQIVISNDQCKMLERGEVQIVQMNTIFDC